MFFFYLKWKDSAPSNPIDPQSVIQRLAPYSSPDKSGFLGDGVHNLMVQCVHWNTTRSRLEPVPLQRSSPRIDAASWARIDNRKELGEKLRLAQAEMDGISDTELIVVCYLQWGEDCVDHLIGDFAFVIHDNAQGKIFCGRDHMGVRPFYYMANDDVFVCATSLAAFPGIYGVSTAVEPAWIAEYLLGLSMSFDRTAYTGIKKIPPAHCLTVNAGRTQLRRYYELSAEPELKLKDSREYVEAYREQLETAITCRLESDYPVGCELSGGLDSSTITAYAARFLDQPQSRLHTFAFALAELEPGYILDVSRQCRIMHNHVFTGRDPDFSESAERAQNLLGYPVEHRNATRHEPFYKLAEKLDIRTLLSGFGGDEFVTTIHGYMVPTELIVQRRFRELYDILPGHSLLRFLRMVKMELRRIKTKNFSQPAFNPKFYESYKQRWESSIVSDEQIDRFDLKQRHFDTARFDAGYTDLKRFTLEKRWQPFVSTRMENCTLMAAGRKIEYRWPLLDVRLVRFFLSVPSKENYYRGMGRYLHRRAVDGIVPDSVVWKKGKDMGSMIRQDTGSVCNRTPITVSDLNPLLIDTLDSEKLSIQIRRWGKVKSLEKPDIGFIQYKRNDHAIAVLDNWLKFLDLFGVRKEEL